MYHPERTKTYVFVMAHEQAITLLQTEARQSLKTVLDRKNGPLVFLGLGVSLISLK